MQGGQVIGENTRKSGPKFAIISSVKSSLKLNFNPLLANEIIAKLDPLFLVPIFAGDLTASVTPGGKPYATLALGV
jgi:hypothetical protein